MRAQSEEERERTRATVEEARELAERLERELAGTPQAQQHLSAQLEETRATLAELRATREKVEALDAELAKERAAGRGAPAGSRRTCATRARRVEQLEASLGGRPPSAPATKRPPDGAVEEMRERVEALAERARASRPPRAPERRGSKSSGRRLAALEGTAPEAPRELSELRRAHHRARRAAGAGARRSAAAATDLSAALDETRARVDELASALAAQAAERDARADDSRQHGHGRARRGARALGAVGAAGPGARPRSAPRSTR